MWCRRTNAGSVDADQSDVLALRKHPSLGRNLPAGAGSSVQPEDGTSLRGAKFGEPNLTIFADGDVPFELRARNRDSHTQSVARRSIHFAGAIGGGPYCSTLAP